MKYTFRKATTVDIPEIWKLLQQAIERRKKEGSNQWQDGYPNPEVIIKDINNDSGYVLTRNAILIGYCAIFINDEPEYDTIEGQWISHSDFIAFHRVAISENYLGRNLSQKMIACIENIAKKKNIYSLKADTNHDNFAMMKIFEKSGFSFCGIVYFRGSPRMAYEKVLTIMQD